MLAIRNGEIVGEDEVLRGMDLLIEDGAIADIVPEGSVGLRPDQVIDAAGAT